MDLQSREFLWITFCFLHFFFYDVCNLYVNRTKGNMRTLGGNVHSEQIQPTSWSTSSCIIEVNFFRWDWTRINRNVPTSSYTDLWTWNRSESKRGDIFWCEWTRFVSLYCVTVPQLTWRATTYGLWTLLEPNVVVLPALRSRLTGFIE